MAGPAARSHIIHASCVALNGQAALITGASGSGKSALALQLMAFGAELVSDDRTCLIRRDDRIIASAPNSIKGQIEARNMGILAAEPASPAIVRCVVDMDMSETDRLPNFHKTDHLGVSLPLIRQVQGPHFAAALWLYLKGDRIA